jgi:hypothetical protein
MATATKLFEMVTADDAEGLEILANSGKTIDWNMKFRGYSLVQRAIELRAVRTFDFLISIPNLTILQTEDYGIIKAIEYYCKAPNDRNKYFIDRLLEKNIKVTHFALSRAQNHIQLFEMLFEKFNKIENEVCYVIYELIDNNNINLIAFIYNYLDNIQPSYYDNDLKREQFNTKLFTRFFQYLRSTSKINEITITILDLIIEKGVSWKHVNNTPTLYLSMMNKKLFDYIYTRYSKLTKEEINMIPNISSINLLHFTNKCGEEETICMIFKLPIQFETFDKVVNSLLTTLCSNNYYWYSDTYLRVRTLLNIIYLSFKKGFVPIEYDQSGINNMLETLVKKINTEKLNIQKGHGYTSRYYCMEDVIHNIRDLIFICEHMGYKFQELYNEAKPNVGLKFIFPENVDLSRNRTTILATVDKLYENMIAPPEEKKTSKKKTTKMTIIV